MPYLTTFHHFPALPVEVRLKIWSFSLLIPRTVTISCNRGDFIPPRAPRIPKSWSANPQTPSLLSVNRESRYEALAFYTPYFTTPSSSRPIYLSFSQDTVEFADGVLSYIPSTELVEIQKMVINTNDCFYFRLNNMNVITMMKKLRHLKIYADGGEPSWWNEGGRHLTELATEFHEAMDAHPEWECPVVRIYDRGTGTGSGYEMRLVDGRVKPEV